MTALTDRPDTDLAHRRLSRPGPATRALVALSILAGAAIAAGAVMTARGASAPPSPPAVASGGCPVEEGSALVCPDTGSAYLTLFGGTTLDAILPLAPALSSYLPGGALALTWEDGTGLRLTVTGPASPIDVAPAGAFSIDLETATERWHDTGTSCTLGVSGADPGAVSGTVLCDGLGSAGGPVTVVATFDAWAPRPPGVRLRLALDGWLSARCGGAPGTATFEGLVDGRPLELTATAATLDAPVDLLLADPATTRLELVDLADGSDASWGGAAGGTSFGSLTLGSDGRSGSIAATLFPATPGTPGDVTVEGAWDCSAA
jgi:hypothetical protein